MTTLSEYLAEKRTAWFAKKELARSDGAAENLDWFILQAQGFPGIRWGRVSYARF